MAGMSGLPPAMPGSGGWITAENLHEHFDGEGNWLPGRGPQEDLSEQDGVLINGFGGAADGEEEEEEGAGRRLGPGAGSVRTREGGDEGAADIDGEGQVEGVDGAHGEGGGEGQRGEGEETKWRRTG